MRMKRFLTLCAATACLSMLQAQPAGTPSWTGTLNSVVAENSDLYRSAPVALTTAGNVYTTGKFNQTVASTKFFLEPVAQSSYLAKYDKDGNEQWAVALAGTATITSVATDAEENVYIAGILADEVVFNTTSGETTKLTGVESPWGGYSTSLSTSFIAKYNKDGVLQTAKSIVPAQHPDVSNLVNDIDGPWYFSEPAFTINHIEISNGKLYASAIYSGKSTFEGAEFQGRLLNYVEAMMIDDLRSGAVFNVSATDLTGASIIADLKATAAVNERQDFVSNITFTVKQNTVYVGANGVGALTLTTAAGNKDYTFSRGEDEIEYAHIIAAINGDQVTEKVYSTISNHSAKNNEGIESMQMSTNGNLYLGGLFYETLAYDNSVTATNTTDLFVASLNPATLEVNGTWVSGYDEQETNVNQENFTTMLVDGNTVYLNGYSDKMSGHAINEALTYIIRDGNISAGAMDGVVTGSAKNGASIVFNAITGDVNTTVSYYANSVTPVTTVKSEADVKAVYADGELLLSTEADVEVYALSGLNVTTAHGANKVNLSHLTNGCYIAKMTTTEGVSVLKFIKK